MKLYRETALSFDDISILPGYSSVGRSADITAGGGESIPIIPSPMINVASSEMLRYFTAIGAMAIVHRYFDSVEDQIKFCTDSDLDLTKLVFSVGSISKYKHWIDTLLSMGVNRFCIDMAHGGSEQSIETCAYLDSAISSFDGNTASSNVIMAGNVCTFDSTLSLYYAGATHIRVGISGGSACRTWLNTGVGLPMVTSIIECHKALCERPRKVYLVADGGIRSGGDVAKAIACGVDYVMLGKMLASTSLASGQEYNEDLSYCQKDVDIPYYKEYFGMASTRARSMTSSQSVNVSIEGAEGLIRFTGNTDYVINNLMHNLRATCGYVGAENLGQLHTKAQIQKISSASYYEKLIHMDQIYK